VKVCRVFASFGAVNVYLVCVLNVSESDVRLGKYVDVNGRVVDRRVGKQQRATSWTPEFS